MGRYPLHPNGINILSESGRDLDAWFGAHYQKSPIVISATGASPAIALTSALQAAVALGTKQIETATAAGTVTVAGNATVTVTGRGIVGSPLAVSVPVVVGNTANAIALAIRTKLGTLSAITDLYDVGGTNATITLTRKVNAINDSTLNVAIVDGTSTGVTTAATSANSTAGVGGLLDVPRNVTVKGNASGNAGNVTVTGTNVSGAVITETIALNGATEVVGNKAFYTVTSVALPAETHAGTDTVSIGIGNKLGLDSKLSHNSVVKTFLNNTLEGTAPTVAVSATVVESNTATLNSALDGNVVDIYYMV